MKAFIQPRYNINALIVINIFDDNKPISRKTSKTANMCTAKRNLFGSVNISSIRLMRPILESPIKIYRCCPVENNAQNKPVIKKITPAPLTVI